MAAERIDVADWIMGVRDEVLYPIAIGFDASPLGIAAECFGQQSVEVLTAVSELIESAKRVLDKEWEYGDEQPHCVRLNAAIDRVQGEGA